NRELAADLVRLRIEALRIDEIGVVVVPGNEESAVRQRHDGRVGLESRGCGVHQLADGKAAGIREHERKNIARQGRHDGEAAVSECSDIVPARVGTDVLGTTYRHSSRAADPKGEVSSVSVLVK